MAKTKTNVVMRAIAFLLSLLMTFYAIPSVVYAEMSDAIGSLSSDNASDSDKSTSSDVPIYEAENLREENVKTFCLPDGSYVAAVYPTAVHRQDELGVWQDINNTLSASGSEYVSGDARVKFAKKITGNGSLFTLHENNTKITFSLVGAIKKTPGEVVKVEVEDDGTELGKLMTLENLNSTIIYRDVLSGVDVEYVLTSNDIKENIIVKEKSEEYVYVFTLKLNNLTATLAESGDVLITCGDKQAYKIPAPVIYDANGVYADTGVGSYALTDNGGGSYTLTVAVSSAWMNSADRAFPVTVDPTLEAKRSAFFIAYVDSNDSEGAVFDPREIPLIPNQTELFVKINNLDFLPRKAYITNAEISFYSGVLSDGSMAAYRIIESWDNGITYGSKPEYSDSMLTYSTSPTYDLARSYFDITEAVKDWWASSAQNYGIAIKATESCTGNITLSGFRTDNVPSFTVSYRNLYGLEDYLAYSSHSIGAGASGHVNLATGNLTLAIPTLTTTDSLMSFTPTLYYNSSMLGKYNRYMHAEVPYAYHAVGVGFKWNIQQSVIKKNNSNASAATAEYYVWADGDGTEHVLRNGVDEDGLQLTYVDNGSTFTITDRSGTVMTFSTTDVPEKAEDIEEAWTLTSIEDKIGNKLIFEYDARWRPTDVYLQPNGKSRILMLYITYLGSALRQITNPFTGDYVRFNNSAEYNGEIVFGDYTYLREIEWVKGGEVVSELQFDYNYEGLILGVTEAVSNYSIDYGYTGKRLKTVTESAGDEVGQKIHFNYGVGYTDVRTSGSDDIYGNGDDIITRNILDNMGRCTATYAKSADNTELYGAASLVYESDSNKANSIKESLSVSGSPTNYLLNGNFSYSFEHWTKTANVRRVWEKAQFDATPGTTESIGQYVYLPTGDYTISFDVTSYAQVDCSMLIRISSISGSEFTFVESVPINDYKASSTIRVSATFTVDNYNGLGGDKVYASIEITGGDTALPSQWALSVDNVMLEEGIGQSESSFVDMGGFSNTSINSSGSVATVPNDVWQSSTEILHTMQTAEPFGDCAVIYADLKSTAYIKQRIYEIDSDSLTNYDYIPSDYFPNVNRTFIVSGFAKAADAVLAQGAVFRLRADVVYYQGEGNAPITVSHYFDFMPGCDDWQFVTGSFSGVVEKVAGDTRKYDCIQYIDIYCEYSHQPNGYALFDNISVIESNDGRVKKYTYYENGLLKSATDGSYEEYYEYNDEYELTRTANNKGELYDYTYDENTGNLICERFYNFTVTEINSRVYPYYVDNPDAYIEKTLKRRTDYTYNAQGLCTHTVTYTEFSEDESVSADAKIVSTAYTYSDDNANFGVLLTETDTLGTTMRYYYNSKARLVATVNEDSGDGYAYIYDAQGRLIGVRPATFVTDTSYSTETNAENVTYTYDERNLLSTITTGSTVYRFYYDSFGNSTQIQVGGSAIASYEYNDYNGKLKKLTYANGLSEEYVYNTLDMLEEVWYTTSDSRVLAYSYEYTSNGELYKFTNHLTDEVTVYNYDSKGRITRSATYSESDMYNDMSEEYSYNADGKLSSYSVKLPYVCGTAAEVYNLLNIYNYDGQGKLTETNLYINDHGGYVKYAYDSFNRLTEKNVWIHDEDDNTPNYSHKVTISYVGSGDNTSSRVDSYTHTIGTASNTNSYEYDEKGNITCISYGDGNEITYEYDNLGQLTRENNTLLNRTYTYEYDNAGNIEEKRVYSFTPVGVDPTDLIYTYSYSYTNEAWGDQLTSFNGTNITYDELGNPINYYTGDRFTWQGRRLVKVEDLLNTLTFTYDDNGIRQSKTVNGVTTNYYWSGSMLIAEETAGNMTVYLYDANGELIGFRYRTASYIKGEWDSYFFEKNLHGDILAVYDFAGTKLISYTYDAWGNFTTTYHSGGAITTATKNNFRYRSYYYDTDMGLYYLMSRYYDSNTGRFISADGYVSTGQGILGNNMYAYCNNNPVMYVDLFGERACSMVTLTQPCLYDPAKLNGISREEKLKRYAIRVARTKAHPYVDKKDVISVNISFSMEDFKSIDPSARKYFYEELRAMSEEVARREGIPLSNLMTVEHIEGETLAHMKVYDMDYFKLLYENTNTVELNVEETLQTMWDRGEKAIKKKLWPF